MKDPIERQDAIDAVHKLIFDFFDICDDDEESPMTYKDEQLLELNKAITTLIKALPSAQPDANEYRKRGEWDMFELITSAWYGKQYYFKEDNGMAYSRKSHKTMTVHDAILEFIREITDE